MTEIRLTKEQKKQTARLEAATGAVAVFRFAPHSLCVSLENQDGLALYYRSAKTLAEIIASGELRQYPDSVQRELMRVWLSGKERKKKCCNMLPSSVYGDTPDTILANAMSEAELLKFGWQLKSSLAKYCVSTLAMLFSRARISFTSRCILR